MAMLYVTHDLGVLGEIADRVGVMYAGHMVEDRADRGALRASRAIPIPAACIASRPRLDQAGEPQRPLRGLLRRQELPPGCPFAPRCDHAEPSCAVNRQHLDAVAARPSRRLPALAGRSPNPQRSPAAASSQQAAGGEREEPLLELRGREPRLWPAGAGCRCAPEVTRSSRLVARHRAAARLLALVGESGSGKSTVARGDQRADRAAVGHHALPRRDAAGDGPRCDPTTLRREIQYVFQNPDASLNPRMTVGGILARPLRVYYGADSSDDAAADRARRSRTCASMPTLSRRAIPTSCPAASASALRSPAP